MAILVYIENTAGKLKKSAFELASYAKSIGDQVGESVTALSIGEVPQNELEKLGQYGVSKILTVNQNETNQFINSAYASIIASAVQQENAKLVILSNSFSGKGLAPRVAAKLTAGLADGAISLPSFEGEKMHIKKSAFSNKAFANLTVVSAIKVISLNPNAFEIKENKTDVEITAFTPSIQATDFNTIVKESVRAS